MKQKLAIMNFPLYLWSKYYCVYHHNTSGIYAPPPWSKLLTCMSFPRASYTLISATYSKLL